MTSSPWEDDAIQFPRLLAEIDATIFFTGPQRDDLQATMDLTPEELRELFDRAQTRWDRIKHNTGGFNGYNPLLSGYNHDLNPGDQADAQDAIAALIFDTPVTDEGIGEETAAQLGRDILLMVLRQFRPDLFEEPLP